MTERDVDAVLEGIRQFLEGDPTFSDGWDPEIEWDFSAYPLPDVPSRGRGKDQLLAVLAEYASGWHDYRAEPREWIDAGDHVVVVMHETAGLRGSRAAVDREITQVWTGREGRATMVRVFKTKQEALEALGLPVTTEGSS